MSAFTRQQAIAFGESGIWRDMTDEQIVRLQLSGPHLCIPLSHFHAALERVLDRIVYSHEFANWGRLQAEYYGDNPKPSFADIYQMLVDLVPPDRNISEFIIEVQP